MQVDLYEVVTGILLLKVTVDPETWCFSWLQIAAGKNTKDET